MKNFQRGTFYYLHNFQYPNNNNRGMICKTYDRYIGIRCLFLNLNYHLA